MRVQAIRGMVGATFRSTVVPMPLRARLGLLLVLLAAACAGPQVEEFVGTRPAFTPEGYFTGHTTAWGYVQDFWGQYRREFTVAIDGRVEGGTLVLDERFAFTDGIKETRVWRIKREDDGGEDGVSTYTGTADDVAGTAEGQAAGQMMRWVYEMDLPLDDGTVRVRFEDWLYQLEQGTLLGRATMRTYGFPLGQVVILFRKLPGSGRTLTAAAP